MLLRRSFVGKPFDLCCRGHPRFYKTNPISSTKFGKQISPSVSSPVEKQDESTTQSLEMQKAVVDMKKIGNILKNRSFYGEVLESHHQVDLD